MKMIYLMSFIGLFTTNVRAHSVEKLPPQRDNSVLLIESFKNNKLIERGTGFYISPQGHMITNLHILESTRNHPAIRLTVTNFNKEKIDIKNIQCSKKPSLDLCIVQLHHNPTEYFKLKSHNILKGEHIYTLGHPKGYLYTLSDGIVSRLFYRDNKNTEYIQVTAPMSPGSSGSPIFNHQSQLLGIATRSHLEPSTQNINIAYSVNQMIQFVNSIKSQKPLTLRQWRQHSLKNTSITQLNKNKNLEKLVDECESGVLHGCYRAGLIFKTKYKKIKTAHLLLKWACSQGHNKSCLYKH